MSTRSLVRGWGVVVSWEEVEQKEKEERNIVPVGCCHGYNFTTIKVFMVTTHSKNGYNRVL